MTCDERKDLLLLYVSDGLETDRAAEMRQHLQSGCPACAGHLAEAQAVMASIPLGLDPIAPPLDLKNKLMARIDAEMAAERNREDAEQRDSLPIRLFRYIVPAAVAAGLAIVCTNWMIHRTVDPRVMELTQQVQTLKSSNDRALILEAGEKLELNAKTQLVDMLQSPEVKLVHLDHTPQQPNAKANLLWDQKQQRWAIFTVGMKPPVKGETFELWFVTDKGAFAAGCFDVDENGNGALAVNIPPGIGQLKTAAVTNEKAGGAAAPAGQFQVLGKLVE